MIVYEKKVRVAHTKRELVEKEARADIKALCEDLAGRINDLQACPDVIKDVVALNDAIDIYIDVLRAVKDEYDEAVSELCEEKWRRENIA